jgi:septal ring factor EnvC (AmiA/AmiB activator)
MLLSVVALAAIAAGAIFFWSSWSDPQVSATLRDIRAAQQQTTSGTKAINDSNAAEDQLAAHLSALQRENAELAERLKETRAQMAQDNASVAEQLKAPTHRDNASPPPRSLRRAMAGVLAKDSEGSLRPQTPLPQPNPTPAIPERRQNVMRNWF